MSCGRTTIGAFALSCGFSLPAALLLMLTGCSSHARPAGDQPVFPKGKMVRVMPLGDSITRGSGSGYGNYRRSLQSLLTSSGFKFQFVGANTEQSQNYHGSDPEQNFSPYQPQHEGYGGFRIEQISADTPAKDDGGVTYPGLSQTLSTGKPDVVLLMLGTNDVNQGFDPGGPGYGGGTGFAADAASRLDTLVTRLIADNPAMTVVVAAIPPLADPVKEKRVQDYNALVPVIAAAHKKQGQNVLFADMHAAVAPADLSPDGIHPGTQGYDKIARAWYQVATGLTPPPPPPLPSAAKAASGPGRPDAPSVFSPSNTVAVSSTFAGSPLPGSRLVDGTSKAFVFGSPSSERVTISGFQGLIGRLRFFDTPSYTGRTPRHVTIYTSPAPHGSLNPGDYSRVGDYPLPVVGDAYENQTSPAVHPDLGDPACHPAATIGYCDLGGLKIPSGTRSLLLDFSKSGGDGDGLSEIQAFAPTEK